MEEIMLIRSILEKNRTPTQCLRCASMGSYQPRNICAPCYRDIPKIQNCCSRCGTPTHINMPTCGRCLAKSGYLDKSLIPCSYVPPLDTWLRSLKDTRNFLPLPVLTQLILDRISAEGNLSFDLIIPLPIHWTRRCVRGYNQCELIANALKETLNAPVSNGILLRSRRVRSQRGLSRSQRLGNQRASFCISSKGIEYLKGKHILLVEDIVTTGATANEAAKTLKSAGANTVLLAAVARTPEAGSL